MTMELSFVKCKLCNFTTFDSKKEMDHVVVESIRALKGSNRVKKIAIVLYERTFLNSEEFKALFDALMELMGYTEKFTLLDCMELSKEMIPTKCNSQYCFKESIKKIWIFGLSAKDDKQYIMLIKVCKDHYEKEKIAGTIIKEEEYISKKPDYKIIKRRLE